MTATYVIVTGRAVSVWDVDDIEAFVRSVYPKTRLKLERDEREELIREGVTIAFHLGTRFQPRMEGYDKDGSFAGYLATFLPKKMFSAWHRWHPEHLQVSVDQEDGTKKKRYIYGDAPESLEKYFTDQDNDGATSGKGLNSERIRTVGDFAK